MLVFVTQSCGSLFKSKDVVPIDSSPRGLYVLNGDGDVLGQTPLFIRVSPKDNDLIFKTSLTGKGQSQHVKCSLSWSRSIVPNLLPIIAGPTGFIISGVFLGTDLVSRGMFDCHKGLNLHLKENLPLVESKKKILVLPVASSDYEKSIDIQHYFLKNVVSEQNNEFLDIRETNEALILRGISHETIRSFEKIDRRNLERVAAQFGSTHALFFEQSENEQGRMITPVLYDLFTRRAVDEKYQSFAFEGQKEKNPLLQKWVQAFNFLPNSVQVSYYFNAKVEAEKRAGIERGYLKYKTGDHPDAFPKYLTLLSLDTVEHPNRFNIWDYNFSFYPSFGGSSWNLNYNQQIADYDISVGAIYALYNIALTGHTFFGALRIHFGIGPGYLIWSDSRNYKKQEVKFVSSVGITYTAFLNDRWYMRMGSAVYGPGGGIESSEKLRIKSWEEYHVGFGYYFPTLKEIIKSWFRR